MRRVTLKQIAEITGVSVSTVSRALSGSSEIGETTRKAILKVCKEEGYVVDQIARSLVAKHTNTIGLIVADISNPYMSEIASKLEQLAWERGYVLMLSSSFHEGEHEEEIIKHMLGRRVDGIIVMPLSGETHKNIRTYSEETPTVFLGQNSVESRQTYVSVDNRMGGNLGTRYLYDMGHKNIVYLGERPASTTHTERATGYMEACKELGIEPRIIKNNENISTIKTGYNMAMKLFEESLGDFTAIFASSDANALGVMAAAEEKGISIPEDISLVGFDNILYASLPNINLTTIDGMKNELSIIAMDTLIDYIEKKTPGYTYHMIPPNLVERKSVKKL